MEWIQARDPSFSFLVLCQKLFLRIHPFQDILIRLLRKTFKKAFFRKSGFQLISHFPLLYSLPEKGGLIIGFTLLLPTA